MGIMKFQPIPWLGLGFILIHGEGWRVINVPGTDHP
jgi:hypothetical protein